MESANAICEGHNKSIFAYLVGLGEQYTNNKVVPEGDHERKYLEMAKAVYLVQKYRNDPRCSRNVWRVEINALAGACAFFSWDNKTKDERCTGNAMVWMVSGKHELLGCTRHCGNRVNIREKLHAPTYDYRSKYFVYTNTEIIDLLMKFKQIDDVKDARDCLNRVQAMLMRHDTGAAVSLIRRFKRKERELPPVEDSDSDDDGDLVIMSSSSTPTDPRAAKKRKVVSPITASIRDP